VTANGDANEQANDRRQRRPMSRWLIGTGIGLIAGAFLVPALAELMPVEGLDYLTGRTPPYHVRVAPAQEDPGRVDIAFVVLLVGVALSLAGLAVRARERRRTAS
jgi:hypothetical protein